MSRAFALALRQLRADWRRFTVCALTLVAGVALMVASVTSLQDMERSLATSANSIQGLGPVSVVPSGAGGSLDDADVQALTSLPDVTRVIPMTSFFTVGRGPGGAEHEINVTGVPVDQGRLGVEGAVDGRLPAAGAEEATVPGSLAERLEVAPGDTLELATDGEVSTVSVVGILDESRTQVYAGNSIFVPLPLAQDTSSQGAGFTRIDLQLAPGVEATPWLAEHSPALSADMSPIDIGSAASSFAPVLTAVHTVLLLCAAAALLLAVALVVVAFAATVRSRTRSYAVLRTVGASPSWLQRSVLWEAGVLGFVASAVGVALGGGASGLVSMALATLLPIESSTPSITWWAVLGGLCVGTLACLLGAWVSTRTLARATVGQLLGEAAHHPNPAWMRRTALGACALVLAALLTLAPWLPGSVAAFVLALTGAGLVAPAAIRAGAWLPRAARWPVGISQDSVLHNQAAGPVVTVMSILITLGVSLSVAVSSIGTAMTNQVTRQFGADVQVTTASPQDSSIDAALRTIPEVTTVSSTSSGQVDVVAAPRDPSSSRLVPALAVDPTSYFESAQLPWVDGSDARTPAQFQASDSSVVLPASLADQLGLAVGDQLRLEGGGSAADVEVVATYASLATGMQIVLPQGTASTLGIDGATSWNVGLQEGADPAATAERVSEALAGIPGVHVSTAHEMREIAESELRTYTLIPSLFTVLVVGLGAIAVAGLITLDVSGRQRTFAILRAVGGSRSSLRAFVLLEALRYAVAGIVVGLVAGLVGGTALNHVLGSVLGTSTRLSVSVIQLILMSGGVLVLMLAAALPTARRVSRLHPATILRTE